jgi:hypothetical protein
MTPDPRQRLQAYANVPVCGMHDYGADTDVCGCVDARPAVVTLAEALEAAWEVVTTAEHYGAPIFGDDIRDAILNNIPEVTP